MEERLSHAHSPDAISAALPMTMRRFAVIDIGSNSIRLVVFDGIRRTPLALFNEKIMCGLGRELHETGRLDQHGVSLALVNLQRFADLVDAMGVDRIETVATAAVREAADGPEFIHQVKRLCGLDVRVLSGEEEAKLSALGVLAGVPVANGVMGDLGGGSLELVRFAGGAVQDHTTLPIGPLRLTENGNGNRRRAREAIDAALTDVAWLQQGRGETLYAVGGSWRSLARVHMGQSAYPLRVIHRYRLRPREIAAVTDLVARQSRESLARIQGVSRRRLDLLPLGALVMSRLLKLLAPAEVEFSAFGLREGLIHSVLPAADQAQDPLIGACREIAQRSARFPEHGAELVGWTRPLFAEEPANYTRLRHAACLLSDIGWRSHPDYRAEHAFHDVLRNPAFHIDHRERAFLALAVYSRYTSRASSGPVQEVERLLDREAAKRARIVGMAARLGETIAGGVPGLIERFSLTVGDTGGGLILRFRRRDERLIGEVVIRRLETLARIMGLDPGTLIHSD